VRIALICRPWSFHGGVETATAGLLGELVRRGVEVEALTPGTPPPVAGLRVRRLRTLPAPSLLRLASLALAGHRALRSGRYDVVHSHERVWSQDVYRAGEGTHRGYLAAMGRGAGGGPYHRAVLALERRIFSLAGAREVVAISRLGKREIERLYGTPAARVTVVYNGVDLVRFRPAASQAVDRGGARAALGLPAEAWVVGFVGSGFERKGLGPLLEALGQLRDARAWLVVAGKGAPGGYRAQAARLGLGERVVWTGPRPDVERLYAALDVLALPARYEPFGNVHLEALASGVPVLTTAAAGGAEAIRPRENGWIAPAPEATAIAEGLRWLRGADPWRLAAAARSSAEPFTYAAQAEALLALWGRLGRR
jgi:UDP-glucose:(heptosyl)LPS alpha-1,3-glucosyltransferase